MSDFVAGVLTGAVGFFLLSLVAVSMVETTRAQRKGKAFALEVERAKRQRSSS